MRLLTLILFVLVLVLILGIGDINAFQGEPEGPDPFADGIASATDESYAEIGGGAGQHLLLDMGEGEDGTGDLDLIYKVAQDTRIVLEFIREAENGERFAIQRKEVLLRPGIKSTLVSYDAPPIPYRYVRLSPMDGKFRIDAVGAETHLPDSDGDGLPDGWELINSLQPFLPQGQDGADGDPDHDMVKNIREYEYGSDPHNSDTDQDRLPDYWEIKHCLSPNDPNGENGPEGDPDRDGISNFVEMGTNGVPTLGCISLPLQVQ